MHFVGMLAARLPFPVDYLVFPTLLSFLVCVIVVGAAVFAASAGLPTLTRLTLSAWLMGAGIVSMHYIGMTALHASAHMQHAPVFVAASIAVAIGASGLALYLATAEGRHPPLYLSAIAFGLAVSGMHYTAMAGLTVFAHATPTLNAPALSTDLLAIVVAVVAFCVSGVFLLVPGAGSRARAARPSATLLDRGAAAAQGGVRRRAALDRPRRSTAPEPRRRRRPRAISRWSATAPPIMSRSKVSWRSTPTPTTRRFSTEPRSCFVRCRSATSNRGSTAAGSSACTAATSSISKSGSDRACGRGPLHGPGQPQPFRLAQVAARLGRTEAANRLSRRLKSAMLTQFVRRDGNSCATRRLVHAIVAAGAHSHPWHQQ